MSFRQFILWTMIGVSLHSFQSSSAQARSLIAADENCAVSDSSRKGRIRYLESRISETRGQIEVAGKARRDLEDVLRSMNKSYKFSGYIFLASVALLNAATLGELQLSGGNSILLKLSAVMLATSAATQINYPVLAKQALEQRPLHQLYLILNPQEAPTPTERSFYSDPRFVLVRNFMSAPNCRRATCSIDHPVLLELFALAYHAWRTKKSQLDDENKWYVPEAFDHASARELAEADIPYARFLIELLETEQEFFELQLEVLEEDGRVCSEKQARPL